MGRRATCFDNAVTESFFATYKKELIHTRPWNDLADVKPGRSAKLWAVGMGQVRGRPNRMVTVG
jgi:transposase InsO family protein